RTLRRLRGAIAGSTAAAGLVREIAPDLPGTVLPQLGVAVPPVPEHALHEGLAIGYVGRLVPEKGVDTLLEALAEIRGDRWHLTVVGDGPARERLEALASELRLAARVRWAGALPPEQIERLWQDLDVLVVPSRRYGTWAEAALHVVAEAMAHEVAVIGTDGGVTPEIIGEAGVIVPPGEASALAAALRRLATPAARRSPLGRVPQVVGPRGRSRAHRPPRAARRAAALCGALLLLSVALEARGAARGAGAHPRSHLRPHAAERAAAPGRRHGARPDAGDRAALAHGRLARGAAQPLPAAGAQGVAAGAGLRRGPRGAEAGACD